MTCKLCANYLHTDKNTSSCTSRVAFMAKTDMPSSVYCASVHKTSILYKCIQNQFTVKQYIKPVYCTSVPKPVYCTISQYRECTVTDNFTIQGMYRDRQFHRSNFRTLTELLMDGWNFISALRVCTRDRHFNCITRYKKGFETLINICSSRAASSQLTKKSFLYTLVKVVIC